MVHIITNDGVKINILESGEGPPLVMLPGGGFSSTIFHHQITFFSQHFRVLAIDMRSHGESEKVTYGMRLSRLAKDLKEVIDSLQLQKISFLCHSLGCSVFYNYVDLFSLSNIQQVVLIDQPAALTQNPAWTNEEKLNFGSTYQSLENYSFLNSFSRGDFESIKRKIISSMVSSSISEESRTFIEKNFQISPKAAALLYQDNLNQDWRDVIPRINIPSLVVGGRASITPWQSQLWIHYQIKGSKLLIFDQEESGSHFMFVENPLQFNDNVLKFLHSRASSTIYAR